MQHQQFLITDPFTVLIPHPIFPPCEIEFKEYLEYRELRADFYVLCFRFGDAALTATPQLLCLRV